jgi:hypothetical protein
VDGKLTSSASVLLRIGSAGGRTATTYELSILLVVLVVLLLVLVVAGPRGATWGFAFAFRLPHVGYLLLGGRHGSLAYGVAVHFGRCSLLRTLFLRRWGYTLMFQCLCHSTGTSFRFVGRQWLVGTVQIDEPTMGIEWAVNGQ